jgi:lycopene beta-cyclase
MQRKQADIVIVGAGLSGSLAAWVLKRAGFHVRLVERNGAPGGNHTWSFFETDLDADGARLVEPFVSAAWPRYSLRFPRYDRVLETGYRSIASERFAAMVAAELGEDLVVNAAVTEIAPERVTLASGETIAAACVIDARGAGPAAHLWLGFQKFLGLEARLRAPHGQPHPIIMDATVPQDDGYRFVYTLPFAPDRILIEDTYYSDGPALSDSALRARIHDYARARGWEIAGILREEQGVLPIILAGDIEAHLASQPAGVPRIGLAAALFHPTTGYALPDAVRVAALLGAHAASGAPMTTEAVRRRLEAFLRTLWRQRGYFRLLNRMMFRAGVPELRYQILEHFYGLNAGLLQRFYAARLTPADRLRILIGRPPVPILSALACVSERQALRRARCA